MNSLWKSGGVCLTLAILSPSLLIGDDSSAKTEDTKVEETDSSPSPSVELSIPPLDHVEYPESRPEWVTENLWIDNELSDEANHTAAIVTGPSDTPEDAAEELAWMQRAVTSTFIARLVDSDSGSDFYPISDEQISERLVSKQYSGEVTVGGSTKYEQAVEIQFDEEIRSEIESAWKHREVGHRLGALGFTAGLGSILLICASGLMGIASRRVAKKEAMQSID